MAHEPCALPNLSCCTLQVPLWPAAHVRRTVWRGWVKACLALDDVGNARFGRLAAALALKTHAVGCIARAEGAKERGKAT